MTKFEEYCAEFAELEGDERLEMLVELADELPPLSSRRAAAPLPPSCRVQECQTPVHLWVELVEGRVRVEADVPKNSPTVRGLVAIAVNSFDGLSREGALAMPDDLLPALGLAELLGMTRRHGLGGVVQRIKQVLCRESSSGS